MYQGPEAGCSNFQEVLVDQAINEKLAAEAVTCEPVSARGSLFTGKIQGIPRDLALVGSKKDQ
jgi:hypothetical protein